MTTSILKTFKSRDEISNLNSWTNLQKLVSLDDIKSYLRSEFISKESHKKYNVRKNSLLKIAIQLEKEGKISL